MITRANLVLLALAALQIVLVLVLTGNSVTTEGVSTPGVRPYEALDLAKVERIEITDEDGETAIIEKIPAEGEGAEPSWSLASIGGFPVRESKPKEVVDKLKDLVLGRVLTRKANRLTGLEVSDDRFARHIVVKGAGGSVFVDCFVGEGASWDRIHFRKGGEDIAYAATGISTFDFGTDASSWVDTQFTDYDQAKVCELTLTRGEETLAFERKTRVKEKPEAPKDTEPKDEEPKDTEPTDKPEEEQYWVVVQPEDRAGTELAQGKMESLVRGLCRLYMAEPIGRKEALKYGLEAPTATAVLKLEDGATRTITVGAKREDKEEHYASCSTSDYVVTLREYSVTDYFRKPLKDLLPEKKDDAGSDPDVPPDEGEK